MYDIVIMDAYSYTLVHVYYNVYTVHVYVEYTYICMTLYVHVIMYAYSYTHVHVYYNVYTVHVYVEYTYICMTL